LPPNPVQVVDIATKVNQLERQLHEIETNPKKRRQILQVVGQFTATIKSHISPIPSPEAFKQYEEIHPGTAERLLKMAETQSGHRMALEKKVISGQLWDSRIGQIFGFIISLAFLYASYQLGMNGHDGLAAGLGGTTLVSLVAVFILGRKKQQENLQNKV
jgi:uncharacterized membrane protein